MSRLIRRKPAQRAIQSEKPREEETPLAALILPSDPLPSRFVKTHPWQGEYLTAFSPNSFLQGGSIEEFSRSASRLLKRRISHRILSGGGSSSDGVIPPYAEEGPRLLKTKPFLGDNLTTFAPNALPLTGYFDASIIERARDNAAALVLGATGAKHTGDLVGTEGHTHDSIYSRCAWKQIATFLFVNFAASSIGSSPDECQDALLINTASDNLARGRFWCSKVDAARLIPRFRISNGNAINVSVSLIFDFYEPSTMNLISSNSLVLSTATTRNRVWVEAPPVDLSAAAADPTIASRIPVIVHLIGALTPATEFVALHEFELGVLQ